MATNTTNGVGRKQPGADILDHELASSLIIVFGLILSLNISVSVFNFRFKKLHCVSNNVPPLTCYNLDIHDVKISITIIDYDNFLVEVLLGKQEIKWYIVSHLTYLVLLHYLAK